MVRLLWSVCIKNKRVGYWHEFKAHCKNLCNGRISASAKGLRSMQTEPNKIFNIFLDNLISPLQNIPHNFDSKVEKLLFL